MSNYATNPCRIQVKDLTSPNVKSIRNEILRPRTEGGSQSSHFVA